MKTNPLKQVANLGQSIWLDYIRRDLMDDGGLRRLIEDDGMLGMTSNPSIFEKAIVEGHDYDAEILSLSLAGKDATSMYEAISKRDVQMAADEFRPVYNRLDGKDGYVSLEVNPHLAHDTDGTIEEAIRLWKDVDRPNVFIKVPATIEGLPAIKYLISEGVNINSTLLFGLPRYREVAEAYIGGIEIRLEQGKDVTHVASVASFFLSRIDTLVDPLLKKVIVQGGANAELARQALGQIAIASAKIAYQIFLETFNGTRFTNIKELGARPQRLLFASTGTKNPDYSDVKYIEALIGPETINTVPVETLDAYRDHGNPEVRLNAGTAEALAVMKQLNDIGINIDAITRQLENDGVDKFNKPFDKILETLIKRSSQKLKEKP